MSEQQADRTAGQDIAVSMSYDPIQGLLAARALQSPPRPGVLAAAGRYEILRILGGGAMGMVFLARDPQRNEPVALKLLRPELASQPPALHRFLVEARHMQKLAHPAIVPILDICEHPGGAFYVMPYMAKGSVAGSIEHGRPLDDAAVLRIGQDVAEALAYAHQRGITHRDIKPGNVLLRDDGGALLADFGLGRSVYNDSIIDPSHCPAEGTPAYMAPELADGKAGDTRCDTYSLGALLYEMLTGHPPYDGATPAQILAAVRAGPPVPVLQRAPSASPRLAQIVQWAMARDLAERYAQVDDVARDLRLVAEGKAPLGPHGRRADGRSWAKHWRPAAAITALILAVAAALAYWSHRAVPPRAGSPSTTAAQASFIYDESFDGSDLNRSLWTAGESVSFALPGAPGSGKSACELSGGMLRVWSEAVSSDGYSRHQSASLDSTIDLKPFGDVLLDVDLEAHTSIECEMGVMLTEGQPLKEPDEAVVWLWRGASERHEPFRAKRRTLTVQLSRDGGAALVCDADGLVSRVIDISRLTRWHLRFGVLTAVAGDWETGHADLRIHHASAKPAVFASAVVARITDNAHHPIAGAALRTARGRDTALSSDSGICHLPVDPGSQQLRVEAPGYLPAAYRVEVGRDRVVRLDVRLSKTAVEFGDLVGTIPYDPWHDNLGGIAFLQGQLHYTAHDGEPAWLIRAEVAADTGRIASAERVVQLIDPNGITGVPGPANITMCGLAEHQGTLYGTMTWPGRLHRIDLSTGATCVADLGTPWAYGLASDGRRFWFNEIDYARNKLALRAIDATTYQNVARIPPGDVKLGAGLTFGHGRLWMATAGQILEIDPERAIETGNLAESIVGRFPGRYTMLTFADDHLWAVDEDNNVICKIFVGGSHGTTMPATTTAPVR